MTDTRASDLISENLTAIYGFAFARLYDKDQVEDLTGEIIYEILRSAKNLDNDEAFWGFAWRIAENTFRKFIKRNALRKTAEDLSEEDQWLEPEHSPAELYIEEEEKNEQLYLLRRELSLLAKTHREVCIAYYIDNKSCSQIAKEQKISVDMVKYHLFKTRKLLKEGIGMTRKLGEKSYNPGTFRINFWGDYNKYSQYFDRKLPGSIVLAAYHTALSAEELSMELGVAMPYLEEEIETLEHIGVLKKVGTKYQTNLVIITEEYEERFAKLTESSYTNIANEIFGKAKEILPEIRKLDFNGRGYDDNRLLFAILNMAMVRGYSKAKERSPMNPLPPLPLSCHGWIWGHDNDYVNHRFYGIAMESWNSEGTAFFSVENYKVIKSCQMFDHSGFKMKTEAMCDAILGKTADKRNDTIPQLIQAGFINCTDGILSANFSVFDQSTYDTVCKLIAPISNLASDCMIDISDKAETVLKDYVPASVKDQCADIVKIHHRLDVTAILLENLINSGKLTLPHNKTPLCIYGVRC